MSASTSQQRNEIIRMIRSKGRMSTLDARNNGIMHPAMRVKELRNQGHKIVTNWINQTDHAGIGHRIAVYTIDGGSHA
ncbi:hypothetical protein MMIC_P1801 [Mariprofundus micogutta]|uniref:Winged helix-turn-helix domain-containing protein n=1 Tax=Mariprofundus micogutta TaxID=1921010 RepID=A0A1L8CPH4_9PROT|nr:helix-turn-helix domain-containing protein [Mariprofundus micogutta]GAV20826.1 hypothetical protein MMIC_P1801 [Mariprofundus micogutta]